MVLPGQAAPPTPKGAATLRAHRDAYARGGFAWTWQISQILGAVVARRAARLRATPNHLSLVNVALSWLGAGIAMLAAPEHRLAVVAVILLWQLAYAFDCADGQLARAESIRNPYGALVDVLCDFFAQLAVLAAVVETVAGDRAVPWYVAIGMAGWFGPFLYASVSDARHFHLVSRERSAMVRAVLGLQDYGLQVFVLAAALFVSVPALLVTFGVLVALNTATTAARLVLLVARGTPRDG
jgi:phosphatidylglycerophosphate synthase